MATTVNKQNQLNRDVSTLHVPSCLYLGVKASEVLREFWQCLPSPFPGILKSVLNLVVFVGAAA